MPFGNVMDSCGDGLIDAIGDVTEPLSGMGLQMPFGKMMDRRMGL